MSTKEQAWHIQHAARVAVRAAENIPWNWKEMDVPTFRKYLRVEFPNSYGKLPWVPTTLPKKSLRYS